VKGLSFSISVDRIKDRFIELLGKSFNELLHVDLYVFRLRDGSIPKDLHGVSRFPFFEH